jgi:hypothetical protein
MTQDIEGPRIANAITSIEEEIEVTGEMINAGLRELDILCDPFARSSEITGADLRAVYIAMRRLEPGSCSSARCDQGVDLPERRLRRSSD